MGNAILLVTVVYVSRSLKQRITVVSVSNNAVTVEQAIYKSEILREFPEIDLAMNSIGIFNEVVKLDTRLKDGDRVEIYRPLKINPKDARRIRASRSAH